MSGPACPTCLDNDARSLAENLSLCRGCTHMFQTDLTPTVDYDGEYASRTYARYPMDTTYLRLGYLAGLGLIQPGAEIVDVGYGSGALVQALLTLGVDAKGVEVHSREDGVPRASLGPRLTPSAITMFDSLEHFGNFDALLSTAPHHCVVSLPSRPRDFDTWRDWSSWRHFKPGEHLHYFTTRSLDALMQRWGLRRSDHCRFEDIVRRPQAGLSENIATYHYSQVQP